MSLNDFLRVTFPARFEENLVYHYSTPDMLEVFFRDNADFYCTYYAALNDDHEVVEGWAAVEAYLNEVIGMPTERLKVLKNGYRELFYSDVLSPWFMSFSEEGDLLSQWSMYTSRERGGYAFGFNTDELDSRIAQVRPKDGEERRSYDMWLVPCFYDVASIRKIFGFYFDVIRNDIVHFISVKSVTKKDVLDLANKVSLIAAMVKNESFSSEREWRLVKFPHEPMFKTCEFVGGKLRHKTGMFDKDQPLRNALREIVVSPHGDKRLLGLNASAMTLKYDRHIEIVDSRSSYNGR